jgi:hypothetical protein
MVLLHLMYVRVSVPSLDRRRMKLVRIDNVNCVSSVETRLLKRVVTRVGKENGGDIGHTFGLNEVKGRSVS